MKNRGDPAVKQEKKKTGIEAPETSENQNEFEEAKKKKQMEKAERKKYRRFRIHEKGREFGRGDEVDMLGSGDDARLRHVHKQATTPGFV